MKNLEIVSSRENQMHAFRIGLKQKNGRGDKNSNAALTNVQAAKIRRMYSTGDFSQRKLARMFGVSRPTIGDIVHMRRYI